MLVEIKFAEPGLHLDSLELNADTRTVEAVPRFPLSRYSVIGSVATLGGSGQKIESLLVCDRVTGKVSVRPNASITAPGFDDPSKPKAP